MIIFVDCNNFFVSCERIFNPALIGKPVVVLSNNDGCVVSRSQEAKALGIPMGIPFFKAKEKFALHDVAVYSGNFSLYSDISCRMHTIVQAIGESIGARVEAYSIDEAFIVAPDEGIDHYKIGCQLRQAIKRFIGIPVAVGIAPTKTLAKVAAGQAKKNETRGVCFLQQADVNLALEKLPVQDIWGIGWRTAVQLQGHGITTALQFKQADRAWVRKVFTVTGERTYLELHSIPTITVEQQLPKSMIYSRSFGSRVTSLAQLQEAVSLYCANAAVKLRNHEMATTVVGVYLTTGRHAEMRYSNSAVIQLSQASNYTPALVAYAQDIVQQLYRPGYAYKKVGVYFEGLVEHEQVQQSLFSESASDVQEQRALMQSLDAINNKWGTSTVHYANTGYNQQLWAPQKNHRSSLFTTSWQELPVVRAK